MRKTLVQVLVIVSIGLIAILAVVFYPLMALYDNPFNNRSFDRKVWLSMHGSHDYKNPRGLMVEDLIKNHLRVGMSKAEVIELLGEPDGGKNEERFCYNLGAWSGFGIDPDYLYCGFSSEGKLTKFCQRGS